MATPTADSLLDLEREIESDIIDCLAVLELGLSEALEELDRSRDAAGAFGIEAASRIRETVTASMDHVQAVQQELGALNLALDQFVLTDALDIENLPAFDAWRDRVLAAIHGARKSIEKLETDGDREWSSELESVWRRFRQRLEIVRVHLVIDEEHATDQLEAQRKLLRSRVAELQDQFERDPKKARERLHRLSTGEETSSDLRRLSGWIKALWMWQER